MHGEGSTQQGCQYNNSNRYCGASEKGLVMQEESWTNVTELYQELQM